MKTPYKDIYDTLKSNRIVMIVVVVFSTLTTICSLSFAYSVYQTSLNSHFAVNTNGEIIPLAFINERNNFEVEAQHDLQLFFEAFYSIDQTSFEDNIEKALWLGDDSVKERFLQKQSEGFYNEMIANSLIQKVQHIESVVNTQSPYDFKTSLILSLQRASITDYYEIVVSGNIVLLDTRHFPENPHGMLITNFFEESQKKIEYEPRKK